MLWLVRVASAAAPVVISVVATAVLRRRRQHMREQTIREVRSMLQDVIHNQLAVIMLNAQLACAEPEHLERIGMCVQAITHAMEGLSGDELARWRRRYNQQAIERSRAATS